MPVTYLALLDLRIVEVPPSQGQYLRGHGSEPGFLAEGGVLGDAPATADVGEPGYLELSTLNFMSAMEGRAPRRPYLLGRWTDVGFVATGPVVR